MTPTPEAPDPKILVRAADCSEVADFFQHVIDTRFDGLQEALLNPRRARACTEGFLAIDNAAVVGGITVSFCEECKALLDACYVLREYRRHGVGYHLIEAAIGRCRELGRIRISCDATSEAVHRVLKRLPPELLDLVRITPSYETEGNWGLPDEDTIELMRLLRKPDNQ